MLICGDIKRLFFLIPPLSGKYVKNWKLIISFPNADLMKEIGALKSKLNISTNIAAFMK